MWDGLSWVVGMLLILVAFGSDFARGEAQIRAVWWYTLNAVVLQIIFGLVVQLYLGRSRIGTFRETMSAAVTTLLIGLPLGLAWVVLSAELPRGVAVVQPMLALAFMLSGRGLFRALRNSRPRSANADATPAIVYGAGNAGHQLATLVSLAEEPPYRILGYVDDDPGKRRLHVHGHRVLGRGEDLARVARALGATVVIVAITNASPDLLTRAQETCDKNGLQLVAIPPVREMIGGRVTLAGIRKLTVADLLGRRPISTDLSTIAEHITGKVVLVTGAGGSIGSELALQVHRLGPSRLVCLDRDESALHSLQLAIYGHGLLDTEDMVLCDIRDIDALRAVFEAHRPEVVFHAAALKHLPMLERFPLEGWKSNVLGTRNVLQCAIDSGVKRLVNISTDKAAAPTSVLGITKRIAERLTSWYAETYGRSYYSVRFGNVLGSRGSVLFSMRAQIERGGPVTVTHPDVDRFFMTIPEACELVLQATAIGGPGDVMVLDMGQPVKILDVARRMIAESGKDVQIRFTGLREGEKLHEVLYSDLEERAETAHPLISHVHVPQLDPAELPQRVLSREEMLVLVDDPVGPPATRGPDNVEVTA